MSFMPSLFRLINKMHNVWFRLKTLFWYRLFFEHIGKHSVLRNPLFIVNPQCISIGDNVVIREGLRIEALRGGRISIGDGSMFEQRCHITSGADLRIGKNVTFLFDVMLTDIDHEFRELDVHIQKQPYIVHPSAIGNNCFIGSGAKLLAGTILGEQCVVGANSVVRGTFPDRCVIAGAPARIVRRYNPVSEQWEKTDAQGNFLH